jgi:hypothetical protein
MPKLQRIDGKVKHYAYTPEGKRQYERDKAAMKMSPSTWNEDEAGLPYVYTNPKMAKRKRPTPKVDQSKRRKPTPVKSKKQGMGGPSWGEFPKPTK